MIFSVHSSSSTTVTQTSTDDNTNTVMASIDGHCMPSLAASEASPDVEQPTLPSSTSSSLSAVFDDSFAARIDSSMVKYSSKRPREEGEGVQEYEEAIQRHARFTILNSICHVCCGTDRVWYDTPCCRRHICMSCMERDGLRMTCLVHREYSFTAFEALRNKTMRGDQEFDSFDHASHFISLFPSLTCQQANVEPSFEAHIEPALESSLEIPEPQPMEPPFVPPFEPSFDSSLENPEFYGAPIEPLDAREQALQRYTSQPVEPLPEDVGNIILTEPTPEPRDAFAMYSRDLAFFAASLRAFYRIV